MPCFTEKPEGLLLRVRVQPKASRNQLDGVVDDMLRIRLTAPPVEGAANEACKAFLAEAFEVAKSRVRLVAGEKAREKLFLIEGDAISLKNRLATLLERSPPRSAGEG